MINNIKKYFNGVIAESKKITWPTKKTVINHTVLVVLAIAVMMLVFGVLDLGFSKILEYFLIKG